FIGDLADMQQTILAWNHLHDGAEVEQLEHRTFIDLAYFNRSSQFFDTTLGFLTGSSINGSDGNHAFIADVDLGTGFFGQRTDHCTTLADHVTDFCRIDLDGDQTRRKIRQLARGAARYRFFHFAEDMYAAFLGLRQCDLHDFLGDALDLDIHLQCSNSVGSTCNFK